MVNDDIFNSKIHENKKDISKNKKKHGILNETDQKKIIRTKRTARTAVTLNQALIDDISKHYEYTKEFIDANKLKFT